MHKYSINSKEHVRVLFCIAVLSIGITVLVKYIISLFDVRITFWFDTPSYIGVYYSIYALFDNCLWKIYFFRKIFFIHTPIIDGKWSGEICSSYHNHKKKVKGKLVIRQTWNNIEIKLNTKTSESKSEIAGIVQENKNSYILIYQYNNAPEMNATKTMHSHKGTAILNIKVDLESKMAGQYYSGRDRMNFGSIKFTRNKA